MSYFDIFLHCVSYVAFIIFSQCGVFLKWGYCEFQLMPSAMHHLGALTSFPSVAIFLVSRGSNRVPWQQKGAAFMVCGI